MMRLTQLPTAVATLYRTFGPAGLVRRGRFELRRLTGSFRRSSRGGVVSTESRRGLFTADRAALAACGAMDGAWRGDRVVGGEYQAYRHQWRPLPSDAGWRVHPVTGRAVPPDAPWWKVRLLDPELGDIKDIWEPARFLWVYDLVRAAAAGDSVPYRDCFVGRLTDFVDANPAFTGPQWACGQEAAIRAVAVCYGADNLFQVADPAHQVVDRLLSATGERIDDGIEYALSQRNNHGISEAVGLVVVGDRLLGAHPAASDWYRRGRRLLDRLVREQFAPDGWYIQHSFVYLRMAVDQLVVAQRTLRARGDSLGQATLERLRAAADLVSAVIEPATGLVPNHGANDGSMVHPITTAEYRDFRPLLTAVAASFDRPLEADVEPDREVLAWLRVPTIPRQEVVRPGIQSGSSGWIVLRNATASAFVWAGEYRSRPGHLDALHVDLTVAGREVVVDPGTFSYNSSSPPFRNDLARGAVHNAPIVDGQEPGVRGPRFLWLKWPRAWVRRVYQEDGAMVAELGREGGIERIVRLGPSRLVVSDRFREGIGRRAEWTWTFHPDAGGIAVQLGGQTEAGAERSLAGWFSAWYGDRVRAPVAVISRELGTVPSYEWIIDFTRV